MLKSLPSTKRKNGCHYTLVERTDAVALYSQSYHSNGPIIGFEVFRVAEIPLHPEAVKRGSCYTTQEKFPANADFGKTAWAYSQYETAKQKYVWLVKNPPKQDKE